MIQNAPDLPPGMAYINQSGKQTGLHLLRGEHAGERLQY